MSSDQDAVQALQGTSLESFLSSLVVNIVVFAVFIVSFILLRTKLHRIYEPKAYIEGLQDERRMPKLPTTPWGWILPLVRIFNNKEFIMEKSGLDAYFFIRFLRMILIIFVPALLLVWPILLPINIVDGINDKPAAGQTAVSGLDRLAFGNVSRLHVGRYWAHLVLAYLFVSWICMVTLYEMIHYVRTRQQWLTSRKHQSKAAATTILVTTIPEDHLNEQKLTELYSSLPGGIRNIWLNRDYSKLLNDCDRRDAVAKQLESAELLLIKQAVKNAQKKTSLDNRKPFKEEKAYEFVAPDDRPQHRLPLWSWFISLPNWLFIGEKVDTIDWCKAQLSKLNPEVEEKQRNPTQYSQMNSAFIQFNSQIAAHMAVQCISHHTVKAMTPAYLEISPQDIVWNNMQMHWWERYIWIAVIWALVIALTIFYIIPTAFIGSLTHITDLINLLPWLSFLNTDRSGAKFWAGLVTGVLPAALLGLIMLLVPIVLKLGARMQGHPTRKDISLAVQNMFFFFLFIQLFLVITISSGVTSLIDKAVHEPTEIPQLLATNLPKAANFFFSYMLLQGLSTSSGDLLQLWWIIVHYVATSMTSTPRSKWKRWNNMRTNTWGTTYPQFTVLACIGIIYSIIAPLIMGFVIVAFVLFGIAQLNNYMYVYDRSPDTGGLSFPKAIQQIFVGVYFLELCLTGLFFLVRHEDNTGVPCKVQAILMLVLLGCTIVFQFLFYHNFHPLVNYLPLDASTVEEDSTTLLCRSESGQRQHELETLNTSGSTKKRTSHERDLEDSVDAYSEQQDGYVASHNGALLLEAFKHEALRRRTPIIWLPEDDLGVARDEVANMPQHVLASTSGARLNAKGVAEFSTCPPDYVHSDDILL